MAYKCDSCGNTSDEPKECCGAPVAEVAVTEAPVEAPVEAPAEETPVEAPAEEGSSEEPAA